ncbi:uncharacterized protein LOC143179537 [Calliopsis andreniformis]|uniref:uncharacterized protein LOC143179537 n=1 Tax=Calliopsis andreniformis TaxID=337506 RepID=UPI003FCE48F0
MTKCNRSEINLKSTAYNQNGQNYYEQLTAYNSMSSHLRRILLAKCVVDARNKNYMYKRKQLLKQSDRKSRSVTTEITNEMIDRLAYDTQHHPADLLKISCERCFCPCKDQKYLTDCYDYNAVCSRSRCHNLSFPRVNKSESYIFNDQQIKQSTKSEFKIQDDYEHRYDEDLMVYESVSDFLTQGINHQLSMAVNSSRDRHDGCRCSEMGRGCTNTSANRKVCVKDEEAKYAKFVYEITNEIMLNGLYTDDELRNVFKRHLKRNEEFLDMNRMLYEVYQLKIALNMSSDSEDEEIEDLRTRQLLHTSRVRPPTPPKVLNENKVAEKLMSYQESKAINPNREKSVLLIDANPELLVTERDILTSLIEANITPEEAQKIYRKLSIKSKDIPAHPIPFTTERSSEELTTIKDNSISEELNALYKVNEQEKSSTTSDLIIEENKHVQT